MQRIAFAIGISALACLTSPCCGISYSGRFVRFGAQQNLIIWDAAKKTEHFIRRATFESDGAELGFIAPTPTVPELVEVDPRAFRTVSSAANEFKRAQNREPLLSRLALSCTQSKSGAPTTSAGGVIRIAQVVNVAGYEAITLQSDDPLALSKWLKQKGFSTNPSVNKWLAYYSLKKWFLTAFIVKTQDGVGTTGLVRMSFKTNKPFNPYYVPEENVAPTRTFRAGLEVTFLSSAIFTPEIKSNLFAADRFQMRRSFTQLLAKQLKLELPAKLAATRCYDQYFPYHGATDDLIFEESAPMPNWPIDPDWYLPWLIMGGLSWRALVVRKRM